ncbi:MAG TPA: competence/damage-inducible protein A [Gemmatimonadales bacterium]|nr:competence/damage-inducible protein A [Gemmatimonadales bacterium]
MTIGTELLLGHTIDTNAAELGRALGAAGVEIVRRTTVPDRPKAIADAVRAALERTGFVLATGGLGPTKDDMTKKVVADLFGKALYLDEGLLKALEARFKRLGRGPMPAINRNQAEVPEGATVLPNPRGSAPGLWIEDAGRVVILLPGVPSEMRGLLIEEVLPRIVARQAKDGGTRVVRSRTLRTTGVSESALAERVGPLEEALAPLSLAYLPSVEGVDLRLTAWSVVPEEADRLLASGGDRLKKELGDHYYGEEETLLAATVIDILKSKSKTVAVAESCTGGMVGARLTAIPGASAVFVGGVVGYDDNVKREQLGVPSEVLEQHGAVSEESARAMAAGAARVFKTSCAIAVTGVAGPGGGTPEKPVGTVWLAVLVDGNTTAVKRTFPGSREEIRARSAQTALDLLRRRFLPGHPSR